MMIMIFVLLTNEVTAARCQVSKISYAYTQYAAPAQQIQVNTTVAGSCTSNGDDYYSVRVDLVDKVSKSILSSSNTPIGYNAKNFTVTAKNGATAPSRNATWPLLVYVYVIRAGGTSGIYLFDYTSIGNATVQVGAVPVPEFYVSSEYPAMFLLAISGLILSYRRFREEHE